jgi:hypothetical protein
MSDAPNYVFEGTPEQKAYAAETIHSRLRAETRLTTGKAALWWLGGTGILLALMGLGVGLAFWGYARYTDVSSTADKLADTLKAVLEKVTVETKGEVKITEGGTILLDTNGQMVALQPGGTVALQPGGTVRVDGGAVRVEGGTVQSTTATGNETTTSFKPTQRQLYGSNPTPESLNEVVEFTTFKSTKFGRGSVHTGWNFRSNRDDTPYYQYCYYLERTVEGNEVKVNLAENGKVVGQPSDRVDIPQAAGFCRWFDGSKTQITASAPTTTTPATPEPFAPSTMSKPAAGASSSDWQNWCRATYPATIQDWCLATFGPGAKMMTQSTPARPTSVKPSTPGRAVQERAPLGDGRLRMDPAQNKSL